MKNPPSSLPPAILACGPEDSLKGEMIDKLNSRFPADGREQLSLYADESSPAELIRELESPGLFSQSRWVILKQLEQKDGGRPELARYLDTVKEYLEDPEPDSLLILLDRAHPYQKGRKTGTLARAVEQAGGDVVVFWEPFENELYQRIREQLKENGLEWESGVIEELCNRCESKWSRIRQEVGKLIEWFETGDRIDREDVIHVVSDEESSDAFSELKEAMTAGDCSRLLEKLDEFYRTKSGGEYQIAHTLTHFLNDLRDVRAMTREGKSLKAALGEKNIPQSQGIIRDFKKALNQVRVRYPEDFFQRSYDVLKKVKYRGTPMNRRTLEQYLLKTVPEVKK